MEYRVAKYKLYGNIDGDWQGGFYRAISIWKELGNYRKIIDRFSYISEDLPRYGYPDLALDFQDSALFYAENFLPVHIPSVYNSRGNTYCFLNNRETQIQQYRIAATLCLEQLETGEYCEDCVFAIQNLIISGSLNTHDIWGAMEFAESQNQFILPNNRDHVAIFYLTHSYLNNRLGNYQKALMFAEWAEELLQNDPHYHYLGVEAKHSALDCLNMVEASEILVNETIKRYREDKPQFADKTICNLAITYVDNGEFEKADSIYRIAGLEVLDNIHSARNKARIERAIGDIAVSDSLFMLALKRAYSNNERAEIFICLARNALSDQRMNQSIMYLEEASRELTDFPFLIEDEVKFDLDRSRFSLQRDQIYSVQAEWFLQMFRMSNDQAYLDSCLNAVNISEKQLDFLIDVGFDSKGLQSKYEQLHSIRLEVLSRSSLDPEQYGLEMFKASESLRSRDLLQHLENRGYKNKNSLDKVSSLQQDLNRRIEATWQEDLKADLRISEEHEIVNQIQDVHKYRFEKAIELGFAAEVNDEDEVLSELKERSLKEEVLILNYMLTDEILYIGLIEGGRTEIIQIDRSRDELNQLINSWTSATLNQQVAGTSVIASLSKNLIPESVWTTEYKSMLILADGSLNLLPFECLEKLGSGIKLIDKFDLSYELSLEHWLTARHKSEDHAEMLAVGPSYSMTDTNALSRGVRDRWLFSRSAAAMSACKPLKNNLKEVEQAAAIFNGQSLAGFQAA